jgi:hypothetical protein
LIQQGEDMAALIFEASWMYKYNQDGTIQTIDAYFGDDSR